MFVLTVDRKNVVAAKAASPNGAGSASRAPGPAALGSGAESDVFARAGMRAPS
jgi:hypothetical protein